MHPPEATHVIKSFAAVLVTAIICSGCSLFGLDGCTAVNALDYNPQADNLDDSCEFSDVVFYKAVDGPPASVSVDGVVIGTATDFFPDGPRSCFTPGNVHFKLTDGEPHDWSVQAGAVTNSGTVSSARFTRCLMVRLY